MDRLLRELARQQLEKEAKKSYQALVEAHEHIRRLAKGYGEVLTGLESIRLYAERGTEHCEPCSQIIQIVQRLQQDAVSFGV